MYRRAMRTVKKVGMGVRTTCRMLPQAVLCGVVGVPWHEIPDHPAIYLPSTPFAGETERRLQRNG